jgi:hypothetical protein
MRDGLLAIGYNGCHAGKSYELFLAAEATAVWSRDDWATANQLDTAREDGPQPLVCRFSNRGLGCQLRDQVHFFWKRDQPWLGENFQMSVL